jgi:hypothetical protein
MFGKGKKMKNDQMALRWIHWVENHLLPWSQTLFFSIFNCSGHWRFTFNGRG